MNDRKPDQEFAELHQLRAKKMVGGGRALAHHDGATWMVHGALPDERFSARADRRRAGIVEARIHEVISDAHPARVLNPCPHAGSCGGCDWPHVDPETGAYLKNTIASEAARGNPELATRLAGAQIHTSPPAYRLRARLHWDPEHHILGFYESRSQKVTAIPNCRILSKQFMKALPTLTATLGKTCPETVDMEWIEGTHEGDAVAALRPSADGPSVIDPSWIPTENDLSPTVSGFHLLSKDGHPRKSWGAFDVTIQLPIPLRVPVGSFFQGNRYLIEPLFRRVAEYAGSSTNPCFDLHAGVGFLAAAVQSAGPRDFTLVEPYEPAARAAQSNIPDAKVEVGLTAEAFLTRATHLPQEVLVVTDPPRTGMTRVLRKQLGEWLPRRILMLGCDPATWARDAGFLGSKGYRLIELELFDLFPSTHHVEILALMDRP